MEDYIKHRQKLVTKSKRKSEISTVSVSSDGCGQAAYEPVDSVEPASASTSSGNTSSAHVQQFLADLVGKFPNISQDVTNFNMCSFPAPSVVPDMPSAHAVGVGGRDPLCRPRMPTGTILPPDAVRQSSSEKPPHSSPFSFYYVHVTELCNKANLSASLLSVRQFLRTSIGVLGSF